MNTKIGSQSREPLEESGYELVDIIQKYGDTFAILRNIEDTMFYGVLEEWIQNDHVASYCIEIKGKGYEFKQTIS